MTITKDEMPWHVVYNGDDKDTTCLVPGKEASELWRLKCIIEEMRANPITDEPSLFGIVRSDIPKWSELKSENEEMKKRLARLEEAARSVIALNKQGILKIKSLEISNYDLRRAELTFEYLREVLK